MAEESTETQVCLSIVPCTNTTIFHVKPYKQYFFAPQELVDDVVD